MKKNLLRTLFLIVALILSSKAFIALIGYQAVESLRQVHGERFSTSYGWISSGFDGTLVYQEVVLTPYALKRPFSISEVRLEYGNYLSLLVHLIDLKSLSIKGLEAIVVDGIRAPLEGRDLDQWLATEYADELMVPLGLYACGNTPRVSNEHLKSMGILEFKSALSVIFPDELSESAYAFEVTADFHELGRMDLALALGQAPEPVSLENWPLHRLDLSYVDNGYFRRLSNLCEQQTGLARQDYAQSAALTWRQAMAEKGMVVSDSLLNTYFTFLSLGGALDFELKPSKPVTLSEIFTRYDEDLFAVHGATVALNEASIQQPELVLSRSYFDPESVKVELVQEPVQEAKSDDPVMLPLPMEELEGQLGRPLVVTLLSGKILEGVLHSSDEFKFELLPNVEKGIGQIAYTVQRENVKEILVQQADQ